ncbi:Holo-[acyl-carrier-protein] synthase [Saezia sanguinis]|jgi:holo-[acyl-carrier-protein] synthase|uniref:Holo-[acyl-carrier-protein] synthase n=1 Tax=Saezia sanguinis TaxID=1965230 RepID=A0A433SCD3_9BURK|nr:holo-ACP synthase [Saezia sanguinis]RUS66403.1 Holo-[acyl-carrier-protein] synthase [Saezia sanguinis]
MIYGIGTDLCEIARVEQAIARHGDRFAERLLGPSELAVYRQRSQKLPVHGIRYLATRFAAKEAFSKAIGLGIHMPMTWRRCEILKKPSGQPYIKLHDELDEWFGQQHLKAHVSVTDEAAYVMAFVVVETIE